MAPHTPGPWRYEPATKTIRSVPQNYWLASMNSWDGAVNHEANAALIAAAPDLLGALKALLFNSRHGNGLEAHHQAQDRAEAAIAKAEGAE